MRQKAIKYRNTRNTYIISIADYTVSTGNACACK